MRRPLLLLASLSLLTACSPQSLQDLGHHFTVAGVVTDATTVPQGTGTIPTGTTPSLLGNPLQGVTVTLISSDHFAPITTGADGTYVFSNVLQGDGLVLLFEKTGYAPATKSLGDLILLDAGVTTSACGCTITPDGLSWNQPMFLVSATGASITGRVVASTGGATSKPLAGATVTLISQDNLAPVTTDANGFFTFTGVKQLTGLRVSVSATGFLTWNGNVFNIGAASFGYLPNGTVASPFIDLGDIAPTAMPLITGIVTDGATLLPLAGVSVKLNSPDALPATTTDANGVYKFFVITESISGGPNWSIIFTKAGFATDTVAISGLNSCINVTPVGGFIQPTCIFDHVMTRAPGTLAGTVRFDGAPAVGATVQLCAGNIGSGSCVSSNGILPGIVGEQVTGATGTFSFSGLILSNQYTLIVLPWDSNGDGINDTQLVQFQCFSIDSASMSCSGISGSQGNENGTSMVINLQDSSKNIVATSFIGGNVAYPLNVGANLSFSTSQMGYLPTATSPIFVQFGAPVDPSVTTFELHQVIQGSNPGSGISAPLPITVTWSGGSTTASDAGVSATNPSIIATIVPTNPLVAFNTQTDITYSLWITSLRWSDGTIGITPTGNVTTSTANEELNFTVFSLPTALPNPTPVVFLGNQTTIIAGQVRQATTATFDYASVYYTDKNSDILSPLTASQGAGTLDLSWPAVAGAASYQIFARNSIASSGTIPPAGSSDWVNLTTGTTITGPVNPSGNGTVVATGVNVWSSPFVNNITGAPWAFGNVVQFAVVSVDQSGNVSPIDPAKALSTSDKWGGRISSVGQDPTGLNNQFGIVTELGDLFNKTVTVTFTEPMVGSALPTLTLTSGAVKLLQTNATALGDGAPSANAPNSASTAWINAQFQATQIPCTELLAARQTGDTLIPVRDSSIFTAGNRLVIINANGSTNQTQGAEVVVASTAVNLVTVNAPGIAPLGPFAPAPAAPPPVLTQGPGTGSAFACAFPSTAAPIAHGAALVGASWCGTSYPGGTQPTTCFPQVIPLAAGAANAFFIGQTVAIYEPATGSGSLTGLTQLSDVVTIIGVDTVDNRIVVNGQNGGGKVAGMTIGNSTTPGATAGHTAASVVVPLPPNSEIALRGATDLTSSMILDVTAPAAAAVLTFSNTPASFPPMVGDLLLLDNDGDLTTTIDQNTVAVLSVHCEPTEGPVATPNFLQTCIVTANTAAPTPTTTSVPGSGQVPPAPTARPPVVLVQGRSKVIHLGESFTVAGEKDTSTNTPLNTHGDQFSIGSPAY